MKVSDIEGTRAKPKHPAAGNRQRMSTNYDSMNYRDVTHDQFKTKRSTNPLTPSYVVKDEDGKDVTIG